jgi:hypothetical protein
LGICCVAKGLPDDSAKQVILICFPDSPSPCFGEGEELVFEEVDLLAPEGLADDSPVLVAAVDELHEIDQFEVYEADDEPDVKSSFVLVPALSPDF